MDKIYYRKRHVTNNGQFDSFECMSYSTTLDKIVETQEDPEFIGWHAKDMDGKDILVRLTLTKEVTVEVK